MRISCFGLAVWALASWSACTVALAQDTRLANQALRCAVLMDALASSLGSQDDQAVRLQRATGIFVQTHAHASANPAHAVSALTGPMNPALHEQWLALSKEADAPRRDRLREEAIVCGAWAEGFLAQGEAQRYVPVYPKIVAPAVRARYGALAARLVFGP